ncbi:hypothetical protein CPB83DRAFT_855493 [Crepidotus variabilis]|uniref:Transmembrane protein n=1 Tax=Crepidotus variabilis TaxID=179855 RepID=A0A9P6EFS8_9AGAR|nr:hypothetical protein CPB83DRAFT_855493 [Crepidotus variabilis]
MSEKLLVELQEESNSYLRYAFIGEKTTNILFGLYIWEWFLSLDFEWDFITGKKKFRWPMIFYFGGRYMMLMCAICYLVLWDVRGNDVNLNCALLFAFVHITGNAALGFSSINLAIRTIVIWNRNKFVTAGLSLILLAELSMIVVDTQDAIRQTSFSTAQSASSNGLAGCISGSTGDWIRVVFALSLTFDLIVLLLNVYKIRQRTHSRIMSFRQNGKVFSVTDMIFTQGLIFFGVSFWANTVQIVILSVPFLRETGMNRLFTLAAYTISTIAACRAVRSLTNFGNQLSNVQLSAAANTSSHIRQPSQNPALSLNRGSSVSQPVIFTKASDLKGNGATFRKAPPRREQPGAPMQLAFPDAENDRDVYFKV